MQGLLLTRFGQHTHAGFLSRKQGFYLDSNKKCAVAGCPAGCTACIDTFCTACSSTYMSCGTGVCILKTGCCKEAPGDTCGSNGHCDTNGGNCVCNGVRPGQGSKPPALVVRRISPPPCWSISLFRRPAAARPCGSCCQGHCCGLVSSCAGVKAASFYGFCCRSSAQHFERSAVVQSLHCSPFTISNLPLSLLI